MLSRRVAYCRISQLSTAYTADATFALSCTKKHRITSQTCTKTGTEIPLHHTARTPLQVTAHPARQRVTGRNALRNRKPGRNCRPGDSSRLSNYVGCERSIRPHLECDFGTIHPQGSPTMSASSGRALPPCNTTPRTRDALRFKPSRKARIPIASLVLT